MHTIRLRFPWEKTAAGAAAERVDVPERPSADGANTQVACVYRRSFNRPPKLTETDRVWLAIGDWQGELRAVRINGQPLCVTASTGPLDLDVTHVLAAHNQIEIELAGNGRIPSRITGEVTLQIGEER